MTTTDTQPHFENRLQQRRWPALLAIVVLIALPVRLYLSMRAAMISRDGVGFIWYAQNLADHPAAEMRRQDQHPLYPAMVLGMHSLFERAAGFSPRSAVRAEARGSLWRDPVINWQAAAMTVTLLGGMAVVVAIYALARTLFDARIGLIAAAMAALTAEFCQLSADALTDMPHLAVYLIALVCAINGVKHRSKRFLFLSGVLSGMAFLIRPEGAEVAVVTAGVVAFFVPWRLRERLIAVALISAGGLLLAGPYMTVTGKLVKKKSVARFLHWSDASEHDRGLKLTDEGAIRFRPSRATVRAEARGSLVGVGNDSLLPVKLLHAFWLILEHWTRAMRVTFLLPAIIWLILRHRWPAEAIGLRMVRLVAALHILILLALIMGFGYWELLSLRHVMILAALALPFSAAGVGAIIDAIPLERRRAVTIGTAIALLAPTLPWMLESRYAHEVYLRRAGEWIRANTEAIPRILTTRHQVSYYANGVQVSSPLDGNVDAILGAARAEKPDWLVFDERRMLKFSPSFFGDMEQALQPGESLNRVQIVTQEGRKDRALIYRYHSVRP